MDPASSPTGMTRAVMAPLPMGMRPFNGTVTSFSRPKPDSPERPRKPRPASTTVAVSRFRVASSRLISRLSGSVSPDDDDGPAGGDGRGGGVSEDGGPP